LKSPQIPTPLRNENTQPGGVREADPESDVLPKKPNLQKKLQETYKPEEREAAIDRILGPKVELLNPELRVALERLNVGV
jgi:hypothetical protein